MSISRSKAKEHKPLKNSGGKASNDLPPLRNLSVVAPSADPPAETQRRRADGENSPAYEREAAHPRSSIGTDGVVLATTVPLAEEFNEGSGKAARKAKKLARDREALQSERWLARNGHGWTFFVLYLFSIMVLFRPYELVPGLGFLSGTAMYFAIATLAIFLPSQLATEGNLTTFSTEVKAILVMTIIALATIPIAKDPGMAWESFNDPFIKAVVMFIVLVNVVRTRKRLIQMMWLSLGIGVYLSYSALDLYLQGKFNVEEYRVAVDVGGMFGNPNEMAMHFVMMTPLVIVLGIAAKSSLMRVVYFGMAVMFVAANMVTYSRGGFLGLMACSAVLAWKLGRKYRLNVSIASIVIGGIAMIAAPGNYGLRMLSIFIPGLDAVGSSDQRWALLNRSILVTARNPWGIGIGNFQIVGVRNLQTHNAFTQVSAELGILGLIAYVVFMVSPYLKLASIERSQFDRDDHDWFYYLAIGLQASIVGYLVSSFFASVAYNWFIYYLIAYAVAFRRIYRLECDAKEEVRSKALWERQPLPAT